MRGRGCKGGMWADDDMQVGVVGGQGAEIGQVLTQNRARLPAVAVVAVAAVVATAAVVVVDAAAAVAIAAAAAMAAVAIVAASVVAAAAITPAATVAAPVTPLFSPCTHSSCLGFAFVQPSSFLPPLLRARLCFICVSCQT